MLAFALSFPLLLGVSLPVSCLETTPQRRLLSREFAGRGGWQCRASGGDCISVQICFPIYVDDGPGRVVLTSSAHGWRPPSAARNRGSAGPTLGRVRGCRRSARQCRQGMGFGPVVGVDGLPGAAVRSCRTAVRPVGPVVAIGMWRIGGPGAVSSVRADPDRPWSSRIGRAAAFPIDRFEAPVEGGGPLTAADPAGGLRARRRGTVPLVLWAGLPVVLPWPSYPASCLEGGMTRASCPISWPDLPPELRPACISVGEPFPICRSRRRGREYVRRWVIGWHNPARFSP